MNKEQAKLILEAHEITQTLEDDEERELLEDNNPELLEAYYALYEFAWDHQINERIAHEQILQEYFQDA